MIDQKKREIMKQLYKMLEDHEQPNGTQEYWESLRADCEAFCQRWDGVLHKYAVEFADGLFAALEYEYDKTLDKQTSMI